MEPSKPRGKYPGNMMNTIPGNLEDIVAYPSNKNRNGSRASVNSTASFSRRQFEQSGSMELLTPDNAGLEDYGLGVDAEDYGTDSDLNSEDYWDSEDEDHTDEEAPHFSNSNRNHKFKQDMKEASQQSTNTVGRELLPLPNDDDGVDVDSEEERDILKEIRREIQNKVREELKDELTIYQSKIDHLEKEAAGEVPLTNPEAGQEEKEMEPKLKEAILKMRKLDHILAKKVKREKEVKRDRILLQRRLRDELEQIKPEGRDETREVKTNTEKFLMLTLPPSHNDGVEIHEDEAVPVTPVFHTQLDENEFADRLKNNGNRKSSRYSRRDGESHRSSDRSSQSGATGQNEEDDVKLQGKKQEKKSKNFIKRNIQLASDADNTIAMTDDEKKRINDLLEDLDNIPETESLQANSAWASEDNPFQIVLQPGEGYLPEAGDRDTLEHIDHRLRRLLPPEEFQFLCGSQASMSDRQHILFTRTTIHSDMEFERIGEQALREQKDERDLQTRLKRIEDELSLLNNPMEIEIESPRLSEDALHHLIDQCVTSLSRSTLDVDGDITPHSDYPSSRLSILENPPKLSEDVLQKLLEDARSTASSFRLSTDREGINDVRNHHFTKELGIELITRETWDLILSHDATESDDDTTEVTSLPPENQDEHFIMSRRTPTDLHNGTPLSVQSFRDSEIYEDRPSRASEGRQSRTPFLPEISRTPSLVTQGASASVRPSYNSANSLDMSLSSSAIGTGLSGKGQTLIDQDWIRMDATINPRPPTSDKPNSSPQNSRSRTTTPAQNSL